MIETIIYDRLFENADLVTATNDQIFPGKPTANVPTLPSLVYSCGPVETQETHSGIVPLERYDVTVTAYQRSLRSVLSKFEAAYSAKIFGVASDFYCEFLTEEILRGDPLTQSQVWAAGIRDGYLLRSEIREFLNLPAIEGLDQPLFPLNMGPQLADETANGGPQPDGSTTTAEPQANQSTPTGHQPQPVAA